MWARDAVKELFGLSRGRNWSFETFGSCFRGDFLWPFMSSAVKCPSGHINTVKWECNQMSAVLDLQVVICQREGEERC